MGIRRSIQVLDVVAIIEDVPECGLVRGHVGTVVESLASNAFEVEFCDDAGRTFASAALQTSQIMLLHHHPVNPA